MAKYILFFENSSEKAPFEWNEHFYQILGIIDSNYPVHQWMHFHKKHFALPLKDIRNQLGAAISQKISTLAHNAYKRWQNVPVVYQEHGEYGYYWTYRIFEKIKQPYGKFISPELSVAEFNIKSEIYEKAYHLKEFYAKKIENERRKYRIWAELSSMGFSREVKTSIKQKIGEGTYEDLQHAVVSLIRRYFHLEKEILPKYKNQISNFKTQIQQLQKLA